MERLLKRSQWTVTINYRFAEVINACSEVIRPNQSGTWLDEDMINAYIGLHQHKYAHSVEVWDQDELIGGLYGVMIGEIFCGESMFSYRSNASKYGFLAFAKWLFENNCRMIDCQQDTDHMRSLGSTLLSKEEFWRHIQANQMSNSIDLSGIRYLLKAK
jgi:leucyl/phenylalanyl-tRNA--protein transferase